MLAESEDEFVSKAQPGHGKWLQHQMGFIDENTTLYFWFLTMSVFEPNEMSNVILKSAYRKSNKQKINLKEQIEIIRERRYRDGGFMKEPNT